MEFFFFPLLISWFTFRRPLASVILDEHMAENLKKDVADFLATGSWYTDRGNDFLIIISPPL